MEFLRPFFKDDREGLEKTGRKQDQIIKIKRIELFETLVIVIVDLCPVDDLSFPIGKFHGFGRIDIHVFVVGNVIQHSAIRVFFLVDTDLLVGFLQDLALVIRIDDREILRIIER